MIEINVFLAGICLTLMSTLNNLLTQYLGTYTVTFIVHLSGVILFGGYISFIKKEKIKIFGIKWYLYLAGALGVILVSLTSLIINYLGVAFTTCLSITGQVLASMIIDHFGLFDVKQTSFQIKRIPYIILICIGLYMIYIGG